ncbi:MAG: DEAD/DEAH box helicase [Bacteroidetes bacterium]|nr:DEAD/DEAH box helicase [Bacteroidota bacterium]
MFKNFVSTLKSFFGVKVKAVSAPPAVTAKESKPSPNRRKPLPREKSGGAHLPRDQRKKETPEEYKARHERRRQQQNADILKTAKEEPRRILPAEPWDSSVFKVPVADGKTRFHDFALANEVLHGIFDAGFQYCTPVQAEVLTKSLNGDDVSAQAQTGTGKTAAFLITIFNHLLKNPAKETKAVGTPRALILAPTRELVMQIEKDAKQLGKYTGAEIVSLVGGIDYNKQQNILKSSSAEIIIATPGRLIDFMRKKLVDLSKVEILVLDEADRMLDMGFIPSVRKIVYETPPKARRQTMFFTATMTSEVKRLADSWTRQALEVSIMPEEIAVSTVEQITYITTQSEKFTLLHNLITKLNLERVLIFANRRDEARSLRDTLEAYGITCSLLSGDVDQRQRIKRLENFREGKIRVLVATDVAARGIHVEGISHVINYNLPQDVEEYVHRIGRTGRAGATGISINFADEYDAHEIPKLEEFLGKKVECIYPEEKYLEPVPEVFPQKREKQEQKKIHRRRNHHRPPRRN